jgi:protein-tyrosine phosphatase
MDSIIFDKLFLGDLADATDPQLGERIDRAIAVCNEYELKHKCADSWQVGFHDGLAVDNKIIHRAVSLIHDGIRAGQRVLIHCAAGISRSPMITACYLVKAGHFQNFDAALNYIATRRSKISPAGAIYRSGKSYCATGLRLSETPEPLIVIP